MGYLYEEGVGWGVKWARDLVSVRAVVDVWGAWRSHTVIKLCLGLL